MNIPNIFRNELLTKINQIQRISKATKVPFFCSVVLHSKSINYGRNFILFFILFLETLISTAILFAYQHKTLPPDSIFAFTDKRLIRFSKKNYPAFCIGLRKYLFSFGKNHLYQFLSMSEKLACLSSAIRYKRSFTREIITSHGISTLTGQQALTLSGFSYFRCFDLILARSALAKFDHIESAGHFDAYTALIAQMRQTGEIKYFSGVQHGLFERFLFGKPTPLYFDEYHLLFAESEPYFQMYLSANPICHFSVRKYVTSFSPCNLADKTVAVALQTDNEMLDALLLECLESIALDNCLSILAYAHPATPPHSLERLRKQFPRTRFETTLRCGNVNVILTRYSTLAMDYVAVGIPAIFWAAPDRVCVSTSGNPLIHEIDKLDTLPRLLNHILGTQEHSENESA